MALKPHTAEDAKRIAKRRAERKAWVDANPVKARELTEAWRLANLDRWRAKKKVWSAANPEKARAWSKAWKQANPGAANAMNAARRAGIKQATPAWVDRSEIRKIYELAAWLGWHVDHIHPLKGNNFCGLHVPWNLQVLAPKANTSKSNKLLSEDARP